MEVHPCAAYRTDIPCRNDDHGAVIITRKEVRHEQCLIVLGYILSRTCVWFGDPGSKLELIALR